MAKIKHIYQSDDAVVVDLDVNGMVVSISVRNDVTVNTLNAGLKVAEKITYENGQSVRMNVLPTDRDLAAKQHWHKGIHLNHD